jgi:outer membrane protein TolC
LSAQANGIKHRKELRKQDLEIQAIEYQLFAAKQLNRPQFDLVSGVQFNGLGDQLLGSENGVLPDFVDTDDVGWNVGFEFSMPVGFNQQRLNERYLRLLLTKARSARRQQETEVLHEISYTAKSVEKWMKRLESAKKRLTAAERRLSAVEADFDAGRSPLDLLLRANDSIAQAKIERANAISELTKAQLEFVFRQGVR